MKLFSHPLSIVILFSAILINGENFGGPYFYYILMAIPHGGIHSLFALGGIALLITSWLTCRNPRLTLLLDSISIWLLWLSLFLFFYHSWSFNKGTFAAFIPTLSFFLFLWSSLGRLALDTARLSRPAHP